MCGLVGVVGHSPANQVLYDSLILLQHRGQDAAGITTYDHEGKIFSRKSIGLVRDVFQNHHMLRLQGNVGIGHVRYPTAGRAMSSAEAQPFYVNSPFGIALGHNGNLVNADELKEQLFAEDKRHINTNSDSEILLNVFAHELNKHSMTELTAEDVFYAVAGVHRRVKGGYSVVALVAGRGIVAFRDPNGIRPLVYGKRVHEKGTEYMVASESVALEANGFQLVRDILPGEAIFINNEGKVWTRPCSAHVSNAHCIFEYVYFARPDSVIDGVSVHRARMHMGEKLAKKILREWPNHDIDVVIPIPDTSRTSALELATHLKVNYREGFIKNRYIGRTFIMPGQSLRRKSVRQKLNPISIEFVGKNVLLVDDSIVRGTTSQQIIQMTRDVGARKVYMASAAPPVRYPNVYGIDMPAPSEFVAHNRTVEEIAKEIGADRLIYQDLDDLIDAVRQENPELRNFDCSCFNGKYITGDINSQYLDELQARRNDKAKARVEVETTDITAFEV
ncbi:MAG TPA: amidophosphoribosyltransferase [Gammaproteobacteria bacterium]|nr:amidophosphoribosyltransferase [Gammaproteobacteria bacterium]